MNTIPLSLLLVAVTVVMGTFGSARAQNWHELRIVDGKLYKPQYSDLWGPMKDALVIEVKDDGCFVKYGSAYPYLVKPSGDSVTYYGEVISVTKEGCILTGYYEEGFTKAIVSISEKYKPQPFMVIGLKGVFDSDKVKGFATFEGSYQYTSANGALKTVRKFAIAKDIREKAFVKNLKRPIGETETIVCMKTGQMLDGVPVFDCGLPDTPDNRKLLTNSVPLPKRAKGE